MNFSKIRESFKGVKKISVLILIIIFASIIFLDLLLPSFYGMTIDEPAIIHISSNIASQERNVFCEPIVEGEDCGLSFLPFGWPFAHSLLFKAFGISPSISMLMILLVKILTVFAVFLFTRYVSDKDWIALIASFVFATNSLFFFWSQTLNSVIPTTALIVFVLLFATMFYREKKLWQSSILLLLWAYSISIRTEMIVLIVPIGIVYLKNYKLFNIKKEFLTLLFGLLILSSFISFIPHFIQTQEGFLRSEEQIFGFGVLVSNITLEAGYWVNGYYFPLVFLFLSALGLIWYFKDDFFENSIMISTIIVILFIYLFWHYSDQRRFFITIMPIIALYTVLGVKQLSLVLKPYKSHSRKIFFAAIILVIIILGVSDAIDGFNLVKNIEEEYTLSSKIESMIPDGCLLIMEEPVMLPYMHDSKKISFSSMLQSGLLEKYKGCAYLYYDSFCRERDGCKKFKEETPMKREEIIYDNQIYRLKV